MGWRVERKRSGKLRKKSVVGAFEIAGRKLRQN
jgi:hypothetical protein